MTASTSTSETLREAAARLRKRAEKATDGPWQNCQRDGAIGVDVVPSDRCGVYIVCPDAAAGMADGDAAWIALMSPAVAEPLAVWLGEAANMYALYDNRGWPEKRVQASVSAGDRAGLAFARCILGNSDV